MKLTIEDLKRVIKEEPSLYRYGVNTFSVAPKRPGFKEFEICCRWLSRFKRVKIPRVSSYYLKHVVERLAGTYISNGALIAAAIHLKIPMRFYPGWPNVDIGISKKCPYLSDDRD